MVQPSGGKILLHIYRAPQRKIKEQKREREKSNTGFQPLQVEHFLVFGYPTHSITLRALYRVIAQAGYQVAEGGDFLCLCPLGLGGLEYCGFLAYTLTIPVGLLAGRLASGDSWGTGNSCVADQEGKVADMGDA